MREEWCRSRDVVDILKNGVDDFFANRPPNTSDMSWYELLGLLDGVEVKGIGRTKLFKRAEITKNVVKMFEFDNFLKSRLQAQGLDTAGLDFFTRAEFMSKAMNRDEFSQLIIVDLSAQISPNTLWQFKLLPKYLFLENHAAIYHPLQWDLFKNSELSQPLFEYLKTAKTKPRKEKNERGATFNSYLNKITKIQTPTGVKVAGNRY